MATATKKRRRKPNNLDAIDVHLDLIERTVFEVSWNNAERIEAVMTADTPAEARAFAKGFNHVAKDAGNGWDGVAFAGLDELHRCFRAYRAKQAKGGDA